ncbi:MAG: Asp-tRNA(Asn)/Glu-tRNA(Gln) amidotransferase subunit GatA [Candidatus Omnitrophica bacterium]|nr:Asp-tRNA(Asn)/Glu-tRNA(Gln) amidotransferase subunit GatA [Candidatus Omnitrophota bacterium]
MQDYKQYLEKIDQYNDKLNIFVHIDKDVVEKRANAVVEGSLKGVSVGLKDNLCVKDELTTCASHILDGFKPPYDATVVEKLKNAGAILFGKVNMDEFAFGSSCETSFYGSTKNPWNDKYIPGGSSGGSAAAVAAGFVQMALGSDTGGSIRQPASLCGVVGMKPTYGLVSRYGLIAFGSSLDQIGPITRNVTDCAKMLTVISGHDPKDSTSLEIEKTDYSESLVKNIKGMKIGIPKEYFIKGIDPEVELKVKSSIKLMEDLGAQIIEISLPHTEYALSCYYIIAPAEASSNLARFDGVEYGLRGDVDHGMINMYVDTRNKGFGDEAKRRILLGSYCLSSGYYDAYYLKAQKVRTKITEDFICAFKKCDCIITPTSPTPAFKIGERTDDPLAMYLSDIFTIPANLAGIPGMSVPCGFSEKGLPIGLQILGKHCDEKTMLRLAYTFEQNTDFHLREPVLR